MILSLTSSSEADRAYNVAANLQLRKVRLGKFEVSARRTTKKCGVIDRKPDFLILSPVSVITEGHFFIGYMGLQGPESLSDLGKTKGLEPRLQGSVSDYFEAVFLDVDSGERALDSRSLALSPEVDYVNHLSLDFLLCKVRMII